MKLIKKIYKIFFLELAKMQESPLCEHSLKWKLKKTTTTNKQTNKKNDQV